MDIRLIALDLDGTLLTSEKRLSLRNRQALERCIQRGIYIVPATGRTEEGIPEEVKGMPGVRYVISTNGAVVADLTGGQVISSQKMDWELTARLLDIIASYPVMYDVYMEGRGKSESRFLENMEDYGIPDPIRKLIIKTRDIVPSICDYVREKKSPVEKINIFFGDNEIRRQVREALSACPDILITASLPYNLEINHKDATKGNALLKLAEHLGILRDQTMAFGDGENDKTMIEAAGVGVVMANGDETLKRFAKYITKGNDQDGVAEAIERFIL